MLPSLASLSEFAVRIPGGVTAEDTARAQGALDDASALIRAEAGKTWATETLDEYDGPEWVLEDVPAIIATVCISAAKRAFVNPEGIRADAIDGFSRTLANPSPDVYLTKGERRDVRRAANKLGAGVLHMEGYMPIPEKAQLLHDEDDEL